MLYPRSTPDVRVLAASVQVQPRAELTWSQDVFGNVVATAVISESCEELSISMEASIDQTAAEFPTFPIDVRAHAYPFPYLLEESQALGALCVPAEADPQLHLAAWIGQFVSTVPTDTLSLLQQINLAISESISYALREEEGTQTALTTLRNASGSCRDLAALFIEATRRLGFGARAVSGYLYDPLASADAAGSTHAWAEVYLPGAGWVSFDPTRGRVGGANLIPVAIGRTSGQIVPVIGGYLGAAGDSRGMDVSVRVTLVS